MRTYGMSENQQDAVWLGFTPANRSTASPRGCCCRRTMSGVTWGRPVASGGTAGSVGPQMSAAERDELSCGLVLGESFRVIAERLGRSH